MRSKRAEPRALASARARAGALLFHLLAAGFAACMWTIDFGAPNQPALKIEALGPEGANAWPGMPGHALDPAGLVVGEFQLDSKVETEALARLADRGVWAYGLASDGDPRYTEMAAALADLHYVRERRMWCDEHLGATIDHCVFNIDFVACRGEDEEAQVVYARGFVDWLGLPDQSEVCPRHVACIARARVGSRLPMPDLDDEARPTKFGECVAVHESLSVAGGTRPHWYEDRAKLNSAIEGWENTVNDPWGRFDPEDPRDQLEMRMARDTLSYMRLTLEERFGH